MFIAQASGHVGDSLAGCLRAFQESQEDSKMVCTWNDAELEFFTPPPLSISVRAPICDGRGLCGVLFSSTLAGSWDTLCLREKWTEAH